MKTVINLKGLYRMGNEHSNYLNGLYRVGSEHNNKPQGFIQGVEFLYWLSDCLLLRDSVKQELKTHFEIKTHVMLFLILLSLYQDQKYFTYSLLTFNKMYFIALLVCFYSLNYFKHVVEITNTDGRFQATSSCLPQGLQSFIQPFLEKLLSDLLLIKISKKLK